MVGALRLIAPAAAGLSVLLTIAFCASPDTQLKAGIEAAERGDWQTAEAELRSYQRENPESAEAAVWHAQAVVRLGQPFDAILELEPFVKRHPGSVGAVVLYADLLQNVAHNAPLAEKTLIEASQSAPKELQIWSLLGKLYLAKPDPEKAADAFSKARQLAPGDPMIGGGLAYAHGEMGMTAAADSEFQAALNSGGAKNGALLALYASFLQESGRAEKSISFYDQAIACNLDDWQVYVHRAKAYVSVEDYKRAEADALHALETGGERRETRLLLLKVYQKLNQPAKAQEQLDVIARMDNKESKLWATTRELHQALNKAEAAVTRGDCAGAIAPYEQIVKAMPTFYEPWFPLGVCYAQLGRKSDAENALKSYLRAQPLSADGHSVLGLLYLDMGRFSEAQAHLTLALQLDPKEEEARAGLAACHQNPACHPDQ